MTGLGRCCAKTNGMQRHGITLMPLGELDGCFMLLLKFLPTWNHLVVMVGKTTSKFHTWILFFIEDMAFRFNSPQCNEFRKTHRDQRKNYGALFVWIEKVVIEYTGWIEVYCCVLLKYLMTRDTEVINDILPRAVYGCIFRRSWLMLTTMPHDSSQGRKLVN